MPLPVSPPSAAEPGSTARVVLRDGSTAGVRLTTLADRQTMRRFFEHLSSESLRRRFLGVTARVAESVLDRLCDSSDPSRAMTLVVRRHSDEEERFIGVGSYFSTPESPRVAEVAFAVAEGFHGKGIGTALLERLAPLAVEHGFTSFSASTLSDNVEMLDVF